MKRLALIVALTFALPAFAQDVKPVVPTTPPAVEQPKQAEFTLDEYNAMVQLLDLGVKSGGLSVAEAGVVLMKKIRANIEIIQKGQAK